MTSNNYNFQATGTPDHDLIDWMKRNGQETETWHGMNGRTITAWMPLPEPYKKEGEQE